MNSNYNFRALSPKDFEDLVGDLLSARFKCHFESFQVGADGGIDLRGNTSSEERVLVQAKHYIGSSFSDLKKTCRKEAKRKDVIVGKYQRYILATTHPLNPEKKDELLKIFEGFPITQDDILGQDDIASLLRKTPSVERAHFKLWLTGTATLERLLYGRLYDQSETEVEAIQQDLSRFVRHKGVDQAYHILRKNGVLFISGPPGIGKTTLARMICALHITENWELSVAHSVEEVGDAFGLGGQRIVFFDDFLGQVRLTDYLLHEVDTRLPSQILRATKSQKLRLVITTRDYILGSAQTRSEKLLKTISDKESYVLSLKKYSFLDRARILYNHLYFSDLSAEQINGFVKDQFYQKIVKHPNYNPRIIEAVTGKEYAALDGGEICAKVEEILEKPELLWSIPYREHISDASQLLAIIITTQSWNRYSGIAISDAQDHFEKMNIRLGFGLKPHRIKNEFRSALRQLEGNFLSNSNQVITLSNPGVRDFMEAVILEDGWFKTLLSTTYSARELRYLRQLSTDNILSQHNSFLAALQRIYGEDENITLYELSDVMDSIRTVDKKLERTVASELLEKTAKSYAHSSNVYGELDGAKRVMEFIDDGYFSEPLSKKLIEKITLELTEFSETGGDIARDQFSLDEAQSVVSTFYEVECTTEEMKDCISGIIENALDNDSSDLSEMTMSDLESQKSVVEELESYLTYVTNSWSSYSQKYTDKIAEISYQMDEDYRDGYYPSQRRQVQPQVTPSAPIERPMSEDQKTSAMFESLKYK